MANWFLKCEVITLTDANKLTIEPLRMIYGTIWTKIQIFLKFAFGKECDARAIIFV